MKYINKSLFLFLLIPLFTVITNCKTKNKNDLNLQNEISTTLDNTLFDTIINGNQVNLYFLKNKNNMQAAVTNYGGRLVSLLVPDKAGSYTDVVVGYDNINDFTKKGGYYGAIIGRYGNRIANGTFSINGKDYQLSKNNGMNMIHGGTHGFHSQVWKAIQVDEHILKLTYLSKDMEEGFPGNLEVTVVYELTEANELKISYTATTDKKTIVNLTNHTYFNLNGERGGTILDHSLKIFSDQYTPVNSALIPIGKIENVKGSPFDFTNTKTIGQDINTENSQLKNGKGYDHNFVLRVKGTNKMNHAATVSGDKSGIVMDIHTLEPGLQFYSGNFMRGKNTLKNRLKDAYRSAFCLEPQHFPDSPNQPSFPTTVLNPGEVYETQSLYRFSTVKKTD